MNALAKYTEKKGEKLADKPDKRVATVAVMHGSHLLMGKRRDNGKWTTPGGHANDGEDLHSAAVRELEEESGIKAEEHEIEPLAEPKIVWNDKGETVQVQPFKHEPSDRPSTSMKEDPDGEVHRWKWVDTAKGLPDDIKKDLHVPIERNALMQSLGLHSGSKDVKKCSELSKYMQSKGMSDIQTGHDKMLDDDDVDGETKDVVDHKGAKSKNATKSLDTYQKMKGKK